MSAHNCRSGSTSGSPPELTRFNASLYKCDPRKKTKSPLTGGGWGWVTYQLPSGNTSESPPELTRFNASLSKCDPRKKQKAPSQGPTLRSESRGQTRLHYAEPRGGRRSQGGWGWVTYQLPSGSTKTFPSV